MQLNLPQSTNNEMAIDDGLKSSFFVRTNNLLKRVHFQDILWIHADGNYCYLNTYDRKFAARISLKRLFDRLSSQQFIQVHRSYVVQLDQIERINVQANTLTIGQKQLPIGRVYKEKLFRRLKIL